MTRQPGFYCKRKHTYPSRTLKVRDRRICFRSGLRLFLFPRRVFFLDAITLSGNLRNLQWQIKDSNEPDSNNHRGGSETQSD